MSVALDTEIRKLRPAELCTLGQILNISDSWKKLMAIVPKESCDNVPRFTSEHFTLIQNAVQQQRRSAAEIFLDEWSTMGKKRPTLSILLDLLVKAELFRAADYVAGDILKGELPKRPKCGPAAAVDISDETILRLLREQAVLSNDTSDGSSVVLGTLLEHNVDKMTYFPETSLEAMEGNNANMQSTKLASANISPVAEGPSISDNNIVDKKITENVQVSDLMKFSSVELPNLSALMPHTSDKLSLPANIPELDQGTGSNVPPVLVQNHALLGCVYKKQEMLSAELPAVLNEIRQANIVQNYEIRTEELPACLNGQFMSSHSAISTGTLSTNSVSVSDKSTDSVSDDNREKVLEMTSAELPQCVIEFKQDLSGTGLNSPSRSTKNITMNNQNAIQSQELPITVLEYNKHS